MPEKNRQLSLLRTMGSTAIRATGEALRKKFLRLEESSDAMELSPAALRLVKGLDELKGAAMKMGQILSLDRDLLPAGWQAALAGLQSKSTPRSFAEIEKVLLGSLGSLEAFSEIEPVAIHAASMSQVHRGVLKETGQKVAIKVRYPGLKENVHSDLKNMARILKLAGIVAREEDLKRVIAKVQEVFEQELNFELERHKTELFANFLSSEEALVTALTVPALCREDVLVTHWLEGKSLEDWLQQENPDSPARNRVGSLLVRATLLEIFRFRYIQTDPNPANFLVMPSLHLGLVDFGAAVPLSQEIVLPYRRLALAAAEGTKKQVIEAAIELGYLQSSDSAEALDSFVRMMALTSEPFQYQSYEWGSSKLALQIKEESLRFARLTRLRIPPEDLIFMNRRILGTQLFLERLRPVVRTKDLFEEIIRPC